MTLGAWTLGISIRKDFVEEVTLELCQEGREGFFEAS